MAAARYEDDDIRKLDEVVKMLREEDKEDKDDERTISDVLKELNEVIREERKNEPDNFSLYTNDIAEIVFQYQLNYKNPSFYRISKNISEKLMFQ